MDPALSTATPETPAHRASPEVEQAVPVAPYPLPRTTIRRVAGKPTPKSAKGTKNGTAKSAKKSTGVTKPKKKKSSVAGPSHRALGASLKQSGMKLLLQIKGDVLPTVCVKFASASHRSDHLAETTKRRLRPGEMKDKQFNDRFRDAQTEHDELVSTSSVRSLVDGFAEKGLTTDQIARITELIETVSRARMPTDMVGYSVAGEKMQHPTAVGKGLFAESADTASLHSLHDTARKQKVTESLAQSVTDGRPLDETVHEAIGVAVSYTLNNMAAPFTASNVHPHVNPLADGDRSLEALQLREQFKTYAASLGVPQDKADPTETELESLTRPWQRGKLERRLSAARIIPLPNTPLNTAIREKKPLAVPAPVSPMPMAV